MMLKPVKWRLEILLLSSVLVVSGCTTPGKNIIPPGGELTMAQIYQQETGMTTARAQKAMQSTPALMAQFRSSHGPAPNYTGYTQTAANQIDTLFRPLPNPAVPMYVYPHLVYSQGESYPKPGYTTVFYFYRQNHISMPDEESQ